MATLDTPLSGQFYPLWRDVSASATSFQIKGRFEKESESTDAAKYSVGKHIICFNIRSSKEKQELAYININEEPTEIDADEGVYEYTFELISHRGIQSDNSVAPPTKTNANKRKVHKANEAFVGIVSSPEYWQILKNALTNATTTGTETAGEAIDATSGIIGISLHTDNKWYKYHSTNYPDFQGFLPKGESIAIDESFTAYYLNANVSTDGLTRNTIYYVQDGGTLTTTATSTTQLAGKSRGTDFLVGNQDQGIESFADVAEINAGGTTPKLITADQLLEVGDGNRELHSVTLLGDCSDRDAIVGVNNYTVTTTTSSLAFGKVTTASGAGTEAYIPLIGNGTDFTTINIFLRKAGSPTDNIIARIETNTTGGFSPSGTLFDPSSTESIAGTGITTGFVDTTLTYTIQNLDLGKLYWLVLDRDGADSDTNYYWIGGGSQVASSNDHFYLGYTDHNTFSPCGDYGPASKFQANISCAGINSTTVLADAAFFFQIGNGGIWSDNNFAGLANSAGTNGSPLDVLFDGSKDGFTGLTPWEIHSMKTGATFGELEEIGGGYIQSVSDTKVRIRKTSTNLF